MRETHTVIHSKPCESCGRDRFEAGKALVGSFCAECDTPFDSVQFSLGNNLPCGHDAMQNATMRTKDVLRCLNCEHVRDYRIG